jgi:nitrogen fixation protein FixH
MLAVMVAFFGVIIAVNLTMVVASSRTWTGLVVPNSYVEGERFIARQADIARQKAAGWTVATAYEEGQIVFTALDGEGQPVPLTEVSAFIRRPVGGHDDASVALLPRDRSYAGALVLGPGMWDITVTTAETALGAIQYERRVEVK